MNKTAMSENTLQLYMDYIEAKRFMELLMQKVNATKPYYQRVKAIYEHARLKELKSMDYQDYLQTDEWQRVRREAVENAHGKCQQCGASGVELHVHHKTYERRGEELHDDLMVLCKDCHAKVHRLQGEGKIPEVG